MYYVKSNNLDFAQQIKLLGDNIDSIKGLFSFTADDVKEAIADADFMLLICNDSNNAEAFYHASTDYTYTVRHGADDKTIIPVPVMTVNPIVPVVVAEGIQKRYTQKINQIKASKNCSDDLLKKLDVYKTVAAKDSTLAKPDPKVALDGGFPVISYHKYGFGAANLYKDSGTGYGATPYKTMTTTSFKDPAPLPAAGQSLIWKYKMMYLLNDEETGIISDEISIAVRGK